jgi:hypothetical protein
VLDKGAALLVPALFHDLAVDLVALDSPLGQVCRESAGCGEANTAVEGGPRIETAVHEVLPAAAGFPHSLVRLVPMLGEPVEDAAELGPGPMADADAMLARKIDGVQCLSVDVEL